MTIASMSNSVSICQSKCYSHSEPASGSHQHPHQHQSPEAVVLTICTTLDISVTIQQLSMIITQRIQLN